MRTRVAIVRCEDYSPDRVRAAVGDAVALLGGAERFFRPGERTLLKPNLCAAQPPEAAATTHPAVIRAVYELAVAVGADPYVGENPVGFSGGNRTAAILEATGVAELIRQQAIRWVKLERAGAVRARNRVGDVDLPIYISRPALEWPVINLPKFKTHSLAVMTGAIKNLWGTLPGRSKRQFHVLAPQSDRFAQILVDVCEMVNPRLTIMDAVVGMEGEGPVGGRPRQVGVIIAGTDPVAVDTVATVMMNLPPELVHTIRVAAERGLGSMELGEIEIAGEPLASLIMADYCPAPITKYSPPLVRKMFEISVLKVAVDPTACHACGECVTHCPTGAVNLRDGVAMIDPQICRECLSCLEVCPSDAIRVERSQLYKVLDSVIG